MIHVEVNSVSIYDHFAAEVYFATEKRFEAPVFMLWHNTPTLVLGKYQNVYEEVDLAYARENNIRIVRRLSGGGTMYTDLGGWQFSFIARSKDEISFTEFIAPIVEALKKMGVEATFNGRNDIAVEGKKISGNSQFKLGDMTIHHGTLLYATDITALVKSTTPDVNKIISKSIKSFRERVTNISEHMKNPMTPEIFGKTLTSHIVSEKYRLTDQDRQRISELTFQMFEKDESVYQKSPTCTITKTGRFSSGKIEFRFDVKKGKMQNVYVSGDFFGTLDREELADALIGCDYTKESVFSSLKSVVTQESLYGISAEEIASLITQGI